jgi:hypothetical protein
MADGFDLLCAESGMAAASAQPIGMTVSDLNME